MSSIDSSGNICGGYTIQVESENMTNKFKISAMAD